MREKERDTEREREKEGQRERRRERKRGVNSRPRWAHGVPTDQSPNGALGARGKAPFWRMKLCRFKRHTRTHRAQWNGKPIGPQSTQGTLGAPCWPNAPQDCVTASFN